MGEQSFYTHRGCTHISARIELTVQVYLVYSAISFQSEVKLERFLYTVRMTVLTSRYTVVPIWIHTVVLEHAVLPVMFTQTSDTHGTSVLVLWKQC